MATTLAHAVRRLPDRDPLLRAVGFVLAVNLVGGLPGLFSSPDTPGFEAS